MSKDKTKIYEAFSFLSNCAKETKPFTPDELAEASGWTLGNTRTNLSKRLSDLIEFRDDKYFVSAEIYRVRLKDFEDLFRQKNRLFTDYLLKVNPSVLVYEFFMPLAKEDRLRESLDNLFYKDTLEQRIREIGIQEIRNALALPDSISDQSVKDSVLKFIENTIGGYSLYFVNGRYRVGNIASRSEVVNRPFAEGPYFIDETTAVVRFILPVDIDEEPIKQINLFEPAKVSLDTTERAEQIRWLFLNFFAEAVTRVIRKEDEIWLLETGMKNSLYRWIRCDEC